MSDVTPLTELANFVGRSPLSSQVEAEQRLAMDNLKRNLAPTPVREKVTDLLGTVLALSARTRRMVQPPVGIDLDVFSPSDERAVKLRIGSTETLR